MSDVGSSRTGAASKHNYVVPPVTYIYDKFEKPRGYSNATRVNDSDIEHEFADLPMAPAFPGTEA